jgi:hydroxylamine reductase (hybrid-cluster protein)
MVSLGMFGTVLLILLVILCWVTRNAIFPALVALTLGITLAISPGPMGDTSKAAVNGLRTALATFSTTLFGSSGNA